MKIYNVCNSVDGAVYFKLVTITLNVTLSIKYTNSIDRFKDSSFKIGNFKIKLSRKVARSNA